MVQTLLAQNAAPAPASPSPSQKKPDPTPLNRGGSLSVRLIALLQASGIGLGLASEIIGAEADQLQAIAEGSDQFPDLLRSYQAKLNRPVEERIKNGAAIALDRILLLIASPKSSDKDVLNASRDLLDRYLGKAIQRSELLTANLNVDANEAQLMRDLEAGQNRIAALMAERAKLSSAHKPTAIELDTSGTPIISN